MLEENLGRCLNDYVPNYSLFDLETTGISAWHDDVIEIAAVKVRDGQIVDEFQELVNPGRVIPYAATAVNHISNKMVEGKESFDKVLSRFLEFVDNDVLVGHNIHSFDMKFIKRDCEKYYGKILSNDYVDTLRLSKTVFPHWPHRRLSDLAEYYGLSYSGAHRALADCRINQKVYELLAKELNGTAEIPKHKICLQCGKLMVRKLGPYGEFLGCSGFPKCRFTMPLGD